MLPEEIKMENYLLVITNSTLFSTLPTYPKSLDIFEEKFALKFIFSSILLGFYWLIIMLNIIGTPLN